MSVFTSVTGSTPWRITTAAKSATRDRIVEVATRLFIQDGWENATTRGIAAASDDLTDFSCH
jgi:AcrR family transcriptional regulator